MSFHDGTTKKVDFHAARRFALRLRASVQQISGGGWVRDQRWSWGSMLDLSWQSKWYNATTLAWYELFGSYASTCLAGQKHGGPVSIVTVCKQPSRSIAQSQTGID